MIRHAEILFYVFRDRFIHNSPLELRSNLSSDSFSKNMQLLGSISGSIINPNSKNESIKSNLTDSEWYEIIDVFL